MKADRKETSNSLSAHVVATIVQGAFPVRGIYYIIGSVPSFGVVARETIRGGESRVSELKTKEKKRTKRESSRCCSGLARGIGDGRSLSSSSRSNVRGSERCDGKEGGDGKGEHSRRRRKKRKEGDAVGRWDEKKVNDGSLCCVRESNLERTTTRREQEKRNQWGDDASIDFAHFFHLPLRRRGAEARDEKLEA